MTNIRLTAAELGVPDDVYAALVLVRDELDSERPEVPRPEWLTLNMHSWGSVGEDGPSCGTAYCIGGSICVHLAEAAIRRGARRDWGARFVEADLLLMSLVRQSLALHDLFYDYDASSAGDSARAVAAIDRYLGGCGSDPWLLGES